MTQRHTGYLNVKVSGPGRRPKHGERWPSGDLKRNETPPVLIRRAIDMLQAEARKTILHTPIGHLRLQGRLTDTQVAAADSYMKARAAHDSALGLPSRSPKSPNPEPVRAAGSRREDDDEEILRMRRRYERFREALARALGEMDGRKARDLIDGAVLTHTMPAWAEVALLGKGLDVLAQVQGLTNAGK